MGGVCPGQTPQRAVLWCRRRHMGFPCTNRSPVLILQQYRPLLIPETHWTLRFRFTGPNRWNGFRSRNRPTPRKIRTPPWKILREGVSGYQEMQYGIRSIHQIHRIHLHQAYRRENRLCFDRRSGFHIGARGWPVPGCGRTRGSITLLCRERRLRFAGCREATTLLYALLIAERPAFRASIHFASMQMRPEEHR